MRLKLFVLASLALAAPHARAQALEARHPPGKLAGYIEEVAKLERSSGAVHYRQASKYRTEKRDTSAKITLTDAAPASVSEVMVLAKVEHAGGKWVLTGGRIVDLGYLSKLQTPWF